MYPPKDFGVEIESRFGNPWMFNDFDSIEMLML
jgi:hypothetical protein